MLPKVSVREDACYRESIKVGVRGQRAPDRTGGSDVRPYPKFLPILT